MKKETDNIEETTTKALSIPRIISMWKHSGWGNSIYFTAFHLTPTPKEVDILRCKMESGKIARFKFDKVDVMSDPKDQFFATVSDLEYEE